MSLRNYATLEPNADAQVETNIGTLYIGDDVVFTLSGLDASLDGKTLTIKAGLTIDGTNVWNYTQIVTVVDNRYTLTIPAVKTTQLTSLENYILDLDFEDESDTYGHYVFSAKGVLEGTDTPTPPDTGLEAGKVPYVDPTATTYLFSESASGTAFASGSNPVVDKAYADSHANLLKISSNDTTGGYLNGKLTAGTYTTLTENNDGGDETLEISVDITPTTSVDDSSLTIWMGYSKTRLWSKDATAKQLRYSDDYGATWTNYGTPFIREILAVIEVQNGNIIVSVGEWFGATPGQVYMDDSGTGTNFVVTKTFLSGHSSGYSFDSKNNRILLGEYGTYVTGANSARKVYESTNGGLTWSTFFNETPPDPANSHIHKVYIDKSDDTVYISRGDYATNQATFYKRTGDPGFTDFASDQPTWIETDSDYVYLFGDNTGQIQRVSKTDLFGGSYVESTDLEIVYSATTDGRAEFGTVSFYAGCITTDGAVIAGGLTYGDVHASNNKEAGLLISYNQGDTWQLIEIYKRSYGTSLSHGVAYITVEDTNKNIYIAKNNPYKVYTLNTREVIESNSSDGSVGSGSSLWSRAGTTLAPLNVGDNVASTSYFEAPRYNVNGNAGIDRLFWFLTSSSTRWVIGANGTAESGSNVGSDFSIARYTDGAGYISAPFFIKRSTGYVGIGTSAPSRQLEVNGNSKLLGEVVMESGTDTPLAGDYVKSFSIDNPASGSVTDFYLVNDNPHSISGGYGDMAFAYNNPTGQVWIKTVDGGLTGWEYIVTSESDLAYNPNKFQIIRNEWYDEAANNILYDTVIKGGGGNAILAIPGASPVLYNLDTALRFQTSNPGDYVFYRGVTNRATISSHLNNSRTTRIFFDDLDDGVDTYVWQFGWGDATSGSTNNTDGIYFELDKTNRGDGNFWCVNRSAGVESVIDSGITMAVGQFYIMRVLSIGINTQFYIDGVLVATIATNVPLSDTTTFRHSLHQTAGTNTIHIYSDYDEYKVIYLTERP